MKAFAKGLLVFLLVFFLLIGGLFFFLFNTPSGFETLVRAVWNQKLPSSRLQEFHIAKIHTHPLSGVEIDGLQMKALIEGIETQISADSLGLEMPPGLKFQAPIFWVENLSVKTRDFSLSNMKFKLGLKPMQATPSGYGSIEIEKVNIQPHYRLKDVRGVIANLDPLIIRPAQGSTLNGLVEAEISYESKNGYLAVKGHLTDADMAQLQDVAGDSFKNSKGKFRSEFHIETEQNEIKSIWILAESPSPGGEMNAELFRILLDYLPSNADKKLIQEIIQRRNSVPFDEASFTLKNISNRSFQGQFKFTSKTLNLKLNLDLDVNFNDVEIMKSISNLMQMMGRIQHEE